MVIVSIDHSASALKAVTTIRSLYPMVKILARVLDMDLKDRLLEAGANWVVIETLESSLHIGAEALKVLGVADDEVSELVDSLRKDEMMTPTEVSEEQEAELMAETEALIQTDTDFELPQEDEPTAPQGAEQRPKAG